MHSCLIGRVKKLLTTISRRSIACSQESCEPSLQPICGAPRRDLCPVPTANPKQLTDARESVDSSTTPLRRLFALAEPRKRSRVSMLTSSQLFNAEVSKAEAQSDG